MPVRNGSVHSARSAAWVLLGSAIVRLAKIARPRMRATQALLCFYYSRFRARDDPHRDRLRRAGRLSGLSLPVARPRIRALRTTECQNNHSVTGTLCVLASLPQPDLEVRSLRNAARQYPCARPFVLSPRAANFLPPRNNSVTSASGNDLSRHGREDRETVGPVQGKGGHRL